MRLTGILFLLIFIVFQSTHPLRGATRRSTSKLQVSIISIHAPLAGCDKIQATKIRLSRYFNPRTPCGVRPFLSAVLLVYSVLFQSTHPLRGATCQHHHDHRKHLFQSTHPLRGATEVPWFNVPLELQFQSTHPLRGATGEVWHPDRKGAEFQSTHPLRGATVFVVRGPKWTIFQSTHPLRGATRPRVRHPSPVYYFNPRTPCGVRPTIPTGTRSAGTFQSTHPLRGATLCGSGSREHVEFQSTHPLRGATSITLTEPSAEAISIHAPLAGCDSSNGCKMYFDFYFNPRTPCGVRLRRSAILLSASAISIHAPLAGCDQVHEQKPELPR